MTLSLREFERAISAKRRRAKEETGRNKAERTAADALALMKAIVRRAIMTLFTIKDPDRKYLNAGQSGWLLSTIRERAESYGWASYGFVPLPSDISQMEVVAGWLAWLRRTEGEQSIRRLIAWTLGVQTWKIGMREKCSEQTVRNRIDRSIVAIMRQFMAADFTVEVVEENKLPQPYAMVTEKSTGTDNPVLLKKVYIHDKGFYIGPKRWDDGRRKAEKFVAA